ncbi:MAG: RNA 2',3'-cyclic phosphodiesterase [Rubrobacteraceae bacterium]
MRAFVGIFPPPEVQEALLRAARSVPAPESIRWVRPANVHLTLKFLGDVREESLESLHAILDGVAGRHGPFPVQTSDLGAFPSLGKARVLWAGVDKGSTELSGLAEDVARSLETAGFDREKRAYKAHATLGRVRGRPARLPEGVGLRAPEFDVRRLELVQSRLSPEGATYSTLESYPLRFGGTR